MLDAELCSLNSKFNKIVLMVLKLKWSLQGGTNPLANFEVSGDEISWKNVRTGGAVSLDFIGDELRGAIPSPAGELTLVFRRIQ